MVLAQGVLKRFAARHGIDENVDRAPAAYIPLSAACRCASYLPSVPSVLPPETWTQSGMTGFSRF
jgi:hypothetical protein